MLLRYKIYNYKESIKIHLIKYAYICTPLVGLIIFMLLDKLNFIRINNIEIFLSNIINVSGILAGFLFSTMGIIISLPNNEFIKLLKTNGYMLIIILTMLIGVVSLLLSMLFGMLYININCIGILFIIGISETFLSAYYLFRISYLSNKSI